MLFEPKKSVLQAVFAYVPNMSYCVCIGKIVVYCSPRRNGYVVPQSGIPAVTLMITDSLLSEQKGGAYSLAFVKSKAMWSGLSRFNGGVAMSSCGWSILHKKFHAFSMLCLVQLILGLPVRLSSICLGSPFWVQKVTWCMGCCLGLRRTWPNKRNLLSSNT